MVLTRGEEAITKALAHHALARVVCTSGERALRFSALAPFLRARSCEYIVRNSTLRVLRERPEVCTEQGEGGAGVQGAWCSRGERVLVVCRRKGVCTFPLKA